MSEAIICAKLEKWKILKSCNLMRSCATKEF